MTHSLSLGESWDQSLRESGDHLLPIPSSKKAEVGTDSSGGNMGKSKYSTFGIGDGWQKGASSLGYMYWRSLNFAVSWSQVFVDVARLLNRVILLPFERKIL